MMFGASHTHNLETDQDRAHCLDDLRNVSDAATAARFVARWRRELEGFLCDPLDASEVRDAIEAESARVEEFRELLGQAVAWVEEWSQCVDSDLAGEMDEQTTKWAKAL